MEIENLQKTIYELNSELVKKNIKINDLIESIKDYNCILSSKNSEIKRFKSLINDLKNDVYKNNDYNKITDILKSFNIFNINELYTFLNNLSKNSTATNMFITEPVNNIKCQKDDNSQLKYMVEVIENGSSDSVINKFKFIVDKVILIKRIINCFLNINVNKKAEQVIKTKISNFDSNQNNIEQSEIAAKFPTLQKKNKNVKTEYDKIIMYYYNHNLNYYPVLTKNLQINNNIIEINNNINQKFIANATIIYNFYEIYNKFLNYNEIKTFYYKRNKKRII